MGLLQKLKRILIKLQLETRDWTDIIKQFYSDFHENVNEVKDNAERQSGEKILGSDPNSGRVVKVRLESLDQLLKLEPLMKKKSQYLLNKRTAT